MRGSHEFPLGNGRPARPDRWHADHERPGP
jgi:hypothetical protein